jgi:hypothetical protein
MLLGNPNKKRYGTVHENLLKIHLLYEEGVEDGRFSSKSIESQIR